MLLELGLQLRRKAERELALQHRAAVKGGEAFALGAFGRQAARWGDDSDSESDAGGSVTSSGLNTPAYAPTPREPPSPYDFTFSLAALEAKQVIGRVLLGHSARRRVRKLRIRRRGAVGELRAWGIGADFGLRPEKDRGASFRGAWDGGGRLRRANHKLRAHLLVFPSSSYFVSFMLSNRLSCPWQRATF